MYRSFVRATFVALVLSSLAPRIVRAENQTPDLSPIVIGAPQPFSTQILPNSFAGGTLPSLHSFAKAPYNGEWLLISGMTNGMHDLSGSTGFEPAHHNKDVVVINPTSG